MIKSQTTYSKALAFTLAVMLGTFAGGCGPIGAILSKTVGDPAIPARYKLEQQSLVVLVENFRNPDLSADDAQLLARALQRRIEEKKLVQVVSYDKIMNLRNLRPAEYRKMSTAAIGRAVGADQVLYVDLQASGLSQIAGDGAFQGKAMAMIKIIDAKTGESRWPKDSAEGFAVSSESSLNKGLDPRNAGKVRIALYNNLAADIARLFYDYKPDEVTDDEGQ